MEGGLSSTFNGTYSSSCAIYADSQDEAELGSHIPLSKLTQQPLETRKALSTRSTHRSSDSTLAEQSLPGDTEHRRVPPRQNQQPPHSSWIARWFSFVPQLFAIQSRETSHSHLPSAWQEGYAKFEYDSCECSIMSAMNDVQMVILESPHSWMGVSRLEYSGGSARFTRGC